LLIFYISLEAYFSSPFFAAAYAYAYFDIFRFDDYADTPMLFTPD